MAHAFYLLCQLNSNFFENPYMLRKGNPSPVFTCELLLTISIQITVPKMLPNFFQQIVSNNFLTWK